MKNQEELTILFVDDEPDILSSLKRFLKREPYRKLLAENGPAALGIMNETPVDIIVSDLRMPGMSGLELISEIKRRNPDTIRMMLSGSQDIEQIIEAINTGEVFRFIPKPVEPGSFKNIINDAIDYYRLKTEREELFNELSIKNGQLTEANQTLQKLAANLKRSEEQFRSMNDAAHDAVFMLDENGIIIYRNTAAEKMFRYPRTTHSLQRFSELIPVHPEEIDLHAPCGTLQGDNNRVLETEGISRDGAKLPLEISKGCVHLENGPHSVIIARDITTRIEEQKSRQHYENMQKELESEIEKKLLQSNVPHTLQGAEISRLMQPSGHLDGDFTEFIVYNPHHADLLIGDVMGHGIQSALVAAGLKSLFLKTLAQRQCDIEEFPSLQQILTQVHRRCIHELIELGTFATILCMRLDLMKQQCRMIDCGHNPLIHLQYRTGQSILRKGSNLPIGMMEQEEYSEDTFPVENGDLLVLYSDGITESRSPEGEMFGIERLSSIIEKHSELPVCRIIDIIRQELTAFCLSESFEDDVTCIIISIRENHLQKAP
ncbi:MAG: SpoIIE family protein phosphatase [Chlorobium sp.]|uniref:SpoIIE family protein phosphatase n=1 Tax=Chlorobium sp. TaxID=1095 RepID=UPI0025B8D22E|nr:SpoIIE family protein phosphatase [Chlorobium sp.]MCF8383058.1 SpoIIE family protein phosphatase [Chlorobium sp.]